MDGEEVADAPPSMIETPPSTYLVVTTSRGVVTVRSLTTASAEKTSRGGTVRLGRLGGMLTAGMGDPGAREREKHSPLTPPARPWKGLGPGTTDVPPVAVPGHSARPAVTNELPLSSGRTKSTSADEDECAAILGTSGCAPHTGGGGSALLMLATYELAAPAHIGPHVPGSVLGRPIEFLEPFERPG